MTTEAIIEGVTDLSSKSDKELLLMIREHIQKIKEIVGELKSSYTVTGNVTTPTNTPATNAVASAGTPPTSTANSANTTTVEPSS